MELSPVVNQLLATLPPIDRQVLESACLAVQDLSISSYSSFIWTIRLGDYGYPVSDLFEQGKVEEAFYHHAPACSDKCLSVHPLLSAIRCGKDLNIRCLFYSSYKVLLGFCYCRNYQSQNFVKLFQELSSKFPEFRQASPELEKYWKEAEVANLEIVRVKSLVRREVETFSTIIETYYKTGAEKDMWRVIDFLGTKPLGNRAGEILMATREYCWDKPHNFEQLLRRLSKAQINELIVSTKNIGILPSLASYMTQSQKNSKLWTCFDCYLGISADLVKAYAELGGDIYTPDSKGNPWILCVMARCHWGTFNKSENLREANCLALNVRQPQHDMMFYHSLARPYDKWRIETHKYRCSRFRNLTKVILLCIRRVIGRPLPKPCITLLMPRLVQHEIENGNCMMMEPDELDRICKLRFTAYYLYGFNGGVSRLALSRGIPLMGQGKYLVAESLALQTCRELAAASPNSNLGDSIRAIEDLSLNLRNKYTPKELEQILTNMRVYMYEHSNRDCDPIPLHEMLAFHRLFGFKQAKEPLVKKLKLGQ